MQAIISDIHSNIEALDAVWRDMEKVGVEDVICLGDVIGYGPNPKECVDRVMECRLCLKGNHEEAVLILSRSHGFNPRASSAVKWTAEQFNMLDEAERKANAGRWDFLGSLEESYDSGDILCVHGSPLNYTRGYIYHTDVRNPNKMERIFNQIHHLLFVGHTHTPGIWLEDMTFLPPDDLDYKYELTDRKTIINVGSVGQPRDLDPRACYLLFDGSKVVWRRVSYATQATARKIYNIEALDNFLGDRLMRGR